MTDDTTPDPSGDPAMDVDPMFLALLEDLKRWGALDEWHTEEMHRGENDGSDGVWLVYTMLGRKITIQPRHIEVHLMALMDGWLVARARSCEPHQLHQEEREQIARMKEPDDGPHNEDRAAVDRQERQAPAGEDDPDWGGEDD